ATDGAQPARRWHHVDHFHAIVPPASRLSIVLNNSSCVGVPGIRHPPTNSVGVPPTCIRPPAASPESILAARLGLVRHFTNEIVSRIPASAPIAPHALRPSESCIANSVLTMGSRYPASAAHSAAWAAIEENRCCRSGKCT